ncbi:MAG: MATE family efflux transporter [Bacteroidales bacterium]|nr:MATE family efflux transporter [Bacteroidales bacterium]
MRQDSLNRSILKLAIPNIISNITVPLLGFVDMVLMGHQDSIAYIGAIGLGGTIFSVMYSIFSFMRAGTTGFTAQAYGANDRTEIAYSLYRSLCIALIATILVLSLQNAVEWLSMKLLHGSEEVLHYTSIYFRVRIWAAPAVLCLYAFNGWYIGMQNTTIPMVIAILTNVVNIVLSVIFVNAMGMGVSGVALGTVIAQYCGLVTAIVFLFAKFRHHLIPIRRVILLQADKLKRFFSVNADFMIRSILLVLSIAYFNNQSAKLGDDMLAVNMILMQFFYIFSYFTDGFAYAGEALVGRFTGANDPKQLRQTVKLLLVWGIVIAIPFTALYALFPDWFIGLVSDQPEIIPMAQPYHIYLALIPLITFAAFLWDGIYIGATAACAIRNTMLISALGVFLPASLLLMPPFGNHGLWIAFLLFMVARGLSMTLMAKKAVFSTK